MSDSLHFQFESDFVDSLRCIPMAVRCKLDTCGIKLKLNQWNEFSLESRQSLVNQPCQTPNEVDAYRTHLASLIKTQCTQSDVKTLDINPNPEWNNTAEVPDQLKTTAQTRAQISLTLDQWRSLSSLQRFALIKLSSPSHESHNFIPALQEFGLMDAQDHGPKD